jgi:SAM-dependent methyltransferase
MSHDPEEAVGAHYERLAASYDANWAYSRAYITWMTGQIIKHAAIHPGAAVADIGCGTGLYSRGLATIARLVACTDPSEAMLDQLPLDPALAPVLASAQDVASGHTRLPVSPLDAIVMKEAIHHLPAVDQAETLRGLAGLLGPGGRLLVIMLPTKIGYPLFQAALSKFEQDQPDPDRVAAMLTNAGLTARVTYEGYELAIRKARYLAMVHDRYMSLLATFTDDEIEHGIAEISQRHPEEDLEFTDRFAFVHGTRT